MSLADVLPPSPPTTSSRKQRLPTFQIPPTSTPDDSPASGPPSSLGSRKRVNFSPWTNVHDSTEATNVAKDIEVRPLPPSRNCLASGKSILKFNVQEARITGGHDGSPDVPQSMHEVMESIVHQLIRNDPMECVDAYQTLAAAVKAYDELPEQPILKSKLHLITKSMKQHLTALDNSDPKPADINLVTSALKVLVILVWNSDFSPCLTDEFRLFVLDRAISTIAEHRAPKSVVVHYLHFLATQDFRQNLFTSSRASRLIDALSSLTEHVKGNAIVSERLLVYSRLLDLSKAVMKLKAAMWVDHLLSAMVSTITDTRMKALGLGRKACQCFPPSNSIASTVKAVLDSEQDDRHNKGSATCKKLEKLVVNRDNADAVPQMWAVVMLLCNSSSVNLASWSGLTYWLQLIQRCFNSSDSTLRIQADLAWNRFVYAARPYEASDEKFASMLAKPLVAQLERKLSDKGGKSTYSAAMSSYCNLLYYAMRPAISSQRLTKSWNEYIVKVMKSSFLQNAANADMACRILMSLFWNWKPGQKLWNENRAHENRVVEPEELPTIDCKWVRSKAAPIVELFAALFQHCSWGFAESADQAYVSKAWRSFIKSVRSASSKEIKMSNESRSSVIAILDFVTSLSVPAELHDVEEDRPGRQVPNGVLSSISRIAIAELQVGHVLEALEASPDTLSTTILGTLHHEIEKDLQSNSNSISRQHTDLIIRYADLLNTFLLQEHSSGNSGANCSQCVELLGKALSLLKPDYALPALLKMQEVLAGHIRDEKRLLVSPGLDDVAQAFSKVIGKVEPEVIGKLDALFAAAFASTHRTIVSAMANTWNETFGDCESLQIGPLLVESLQRLRPYVELRMPPGCIGSWSEVRDSYPMYDTQDTGSIPDAGAPIVLRSVQMTDYNPEEREVQVEMDFATGIDAEPVSIVVPRPRHDDSQVMFMPVHSSPPPTAQESQYLTERQREVRDRQRTEPAVVFADLRSSPRPASRAASESRDCGLARKAAKLADRPSTPPLPDHGDEAEIQPSPTPKSRYFRNVADIEIPSSPVSVQDCHDQPPDGNRAAPSPLPQVQTEDAPGMGVDLAEAEGDECSDDAQPQKLKIDNDRAEDMVQDHEQAFDVGQLPSAVDSYPVLKIGEVSPSRNEDPGPSNSAEVEAGPGIGRHISAQIGSLRIRDSAITGHQSSDVNEAQPVQRNNIAEAAHVAALERGLENFDPIGGEAVQLRGHDLGYPRGNVSPPSTPQRASGNINSDELELMTASQLSKDLDWSVVFQGLDKSPASSSMQPTKIQVEASPIQSTSRNSEVRQQGRKRKAAGTHWTRNKKNKKKAQQEPQRITQESFVKIDDGEDDMIEVLTSDQTAPSSPPQIDADGDTFVDAPESQEVQQTKRPTKPRNSSRRKRPARAVRQSSQIDAQDDAFDSQRFRHSGYSPEASVEPVDGLGSVTLVKDPEISSLQPPAETDVVKGPIMVEDERIQEQQEQVASVSGFVGQLDQGADSSKSPFDILGSLQQALDAVKNAPHGSLDLRAIDEMCFQIRFQAQLNGVN